MNTFTLERFDVRNGHTFGTLGVNGFFFFTQETKPVDPGDYQVAWNGTAYTSGDWVIGTHVQLGRNLGLVDGRDQKGKVLRVQGRHSALRKFRNLIGEAAFTLRIKDVSDA